jgi:hypothetical protein
VQTFLASARRGAALSLPGQCMLVRRGDRFWLGPRDGRDAPGGEDSGALARRT